MSEVETLPPRVDPGARRDRRRRRGLRRRIGAIAAIGIPILVIIVVLLAQLGGKTRATVAKSFTGSSIEGDQVTYLLVGTRPSDASGQADWLSVFAMDRNGGHPTAIFIPTGTLTEIPGFGYDSVGKAMALGLVPLQEITVENMLGIQIDHTMVVPDTLFSGIVDRSGGVDVTVPSALLAPRGANQLVPVFQAGRAHFTGAKAVQYLEFQAPDEDELARFPRAQALWEALFARSTAPGARGLAGVVSGFGAGLVTDAAPRDVGAFFAAFAAARADARAFRVLPVEAVGGGGAEDSYRVKQDELDALVAAMLAASRPPSTPGRTIRVQILNGNGRPEVGLQVANLIVPAGFRIAATGNASSFSYSRTRIVVYRDSDLAVAQQIRKLLGVGRVEKGLTQQTIVDITIVVGRDFVAPNR